MRLDVDKQAFARMLRSSFDDFEVQKLRLRDQYEHVGNQSFPTDILERSTRRFLLDPLLKGLGWNPDDPEAIAEEARGLSENQSRFYFDYLGVETATGTPAMLFEAKGYDIEAPHRKDEKVPLAREMSELLSSALHAMHVGKEPDLVVEWVRYLTDLKGYVASLGNGQKTTLKRVAISAGGWLVVFTDPINALGSDAPSSSLISCFASTADMLARSDEIYDVLHRRQITDPLALSMDLQEAFTMLAPSEIARTARGVLVVSGEVGTVMRPFPNRSVYPVVLVETHYRWFALSDQSKRPQSEPTEEDQFEAFRMEFEARGNQLEARIAKWLKRPISPVELKSIEGLPTKSFRAARRSALPGSSNGQSTKAISALSMTVEAGTRPGSEFVVATGEHWHYKRRGAQAACLFHHHRNAREQGVAESRGFVGHSAHSFTEDGQTLHCAHGDHLSIRRARCEVLPVETNLCCHNCIFVKRCWKAAEADLPCPPGDLAT